MLNISPKSISEYINQSEYRSYQILENRASSKIVIKVIGVLLLICFAALFLPWTQNIRSNGYVTTLNAFDKPQKIQALVGGQIQKWAVKEGDIVALGDTIVILTEAKTEYLDPNLIANTKEQEEAKLKSAEAYLNKSAFLREQLTAMAENRTSKLEQLTIKESQVKLEIASTLIELEAAETSVDNATNQLDRMQIMYDKGIKSLTDLESKRLTIRKSKAKQTALLNKIDKYEYEKNSILRQIEMVNAEYNQKVAKTESEIQTAESYRYTLLGETSKLRSKYNQYTQRRNAFVITSPINGRITKVLKNGIGEYVKPQGDIATIVPTDFQKAVELYVRPNDMPLISNGKKVRLQFDGWPAVIFSGWPDNSFGTFGGKVVAIDNDISENGKYRILVIEDDSDKKWPDLIRIGAGAQGLLLLNEVKIYYELWRKLNGFPPDFYNTDKLEKVKNKAPIRKFK